MQTAYTTLALCKYLHRQHTVLLIKNPEPDLVQVTKAVLRSQTCSIVASNCVRGHGSTAESLWQSS